MHPDEQASSASEASDPQSLNHSGSVVTSIAPATAGRSSFSFQFALITLIVLGTAIRLCYPFFHNPLDNLYSDPLKYFQNATFVNPGIMSLIDQPGYEFWLSIVLRITGTNHTAVAIYAGILSAITPWFWYRWMRESLPGKTWALAGFAVVSLLPDWIGMSGYFMQETLLLPLLGAALWFSWRAVRRTDLSSCALASVVWGCAIATKASVVPIGVITIAWMVVRFAASVSKPKAIAFGLLSLLVMSAFYAAGPLKFYCNAGYLTFFPGEYNQLIYESRLRHMEFDFKFKDRITGQEHTEHHWFECPSVVEVPLEPLSAWKSNRRGVCSVLLDYTRSGAPRPILSLPDRVDLTLENWIFYLFGTTWPMNKPLDGGIDYFVSIERWVWFPAAFGIFLVSLLRKPVSFLQVLCLGSLAFFLLQQSYELEGRFRMPWEGLVVACTLLLVRSVSLNCTRIRKIPGDAQT